MNKSYIVVPHGLLLSKEEISKYVIYSKVPEVVEYQQIHPDYIHTYNPDGLLQNLEQVLESITDTQERNIRLVTTEAGMQQFEQAIRDEVARTIEVAQYPLTPDDAFRDFNTQTELGIRFPEVTTGYIQTIGIGTTEELPTVVTATSSEANEIIELPLLDLPEEPTRRARRQTAAPVARELSEEEMIQQLDNLSREDV
jgi:hypothetical protein